MSQQTVVIQLGKGQSDEGLIWLSGIIELFSRIILKTDQLLAWERGRGGGGTASLTHFRTGHDYETSQTKSTSFVSELIYAVCHSIVIFWTY